MHSYIRDGQRSRILQPREFFEPFLSSRIALITQATRVCYESQIYSGFVFWELIKSDFLLMEVILNWKKGFCVISAFLLLNHVILNRALIIYVQIVRYSDN
jgi:hypothetical protein